MVNPCRYPTCYMSESAINLPNICGCCGHFTSTMLSATGRAYTMLRQIEWCYSEIVQLFAIMQIKLAHGPFDAWYTKCHIWGHDLGCSGGSCVQFSSMLVFLCYVICDIADFLQPIQCSANIPIYIMTFIYCWSLPSSSHWYKSWHIWVHWQSAVGVRENVLCH